MASCKIQESKRKARRSISCMLYGMNDDLWDRVCGLGSETWKGCEFVEGFLTDELICRPQKDIFFKEASQRLFCLTEVHRKVH